MGMIHAMPYPLSSKQHDTLHAEKVRMSKKKYCIQVQTQCVTSLSLFIISDKNRHLHANYVPCESVLKNSFFESLVNYKVQNSMCISHLACMAYA